MEAKKTKKADLENKRSVFLMVGIAVALLITLGAFKHRVDERTLMDLGDVQVEQIEEEQTEITRQDDPPPPPPPEPSQELIIVDDKVEIEEERIIDVETTIQTVVREAAPRVVVVVEEEVEERKIFQIVEEQPEFPGGEEARLRFLRDNMNYPMMAREAGIQGTVFVTFVVERDGSISDVQILRGIGGGCDEEAVRVARMMPRWKPGKQRNRPVRTQFRMPIRFALQ